MMYNGKTLQTAISYGVYILSGFLIFTPIHKSKNILISLLTCAFICAILFITIIYIFSKSRSHYESLLLSRIASILVLLLSLFCTLILLTEIIKDIAYIAGRDISLFYYTFTAYFLLFVSFWLCTSNEKGIFRFCILSCLPFFTLFTVMFFALGSTKGIVPIHFDNNYILPSAFTGIKSGILFTADTAAFLYCFKDRIITERKVFPKRILYAGFTGAFIYIAVYYIFACLIFGSLTVKISDPDYALIKLVRGFDLTEIISCVRIVSFLIKSSVWIFLSTKCIRHAFAITRLSVKTTVLLFYAAIPFAFLILAFCNKTLEYGAFQHLIYPAVGLMGLLFTFIYANNEKKN